MGSPCTPASTAAKLLPDIAAAAQAPADAAAAAAAAGSAPALGAPPAAAAAAAAADGACAVEAGAGGGERERVLPAPTCRPAAAQSGGTARSCCTATPRTLRCLESELPSRRRRLPPARPPHLGLLARPNCDLRCAQFPFFGHSAAQRANLQAQGTRRPCPPAAMIGRRRPGGAGSCICA